MVATLVLATALCVPAITSQPAAVDYETFKRYSPNEQLTVIVADMYDVDAPRRSALLAQMNELEERVRMVFTPEDARQAFTIHGDYIPR